MNSIITILLVTVFESFEKENVSNNMEWFFTW